MATVSPDDARYLISKVYNSSSWAEKVRKMSDKQAVAIYLSFCASGKFDKKKPKVNCEKPVEKPVHIAETKIERVDPVVTDECCYGEQLAFDL